MVEFAEKLNQWGAERVPFLFIIDFELEKPIAFRLQEALASNILFTTPEFPNAEIESPQTSVDVAKFPISHEAYQQKFGHVANRLNYGDSFLTNLTIKTKIETNHSLRELFFLAKAKYKLLVNDQFLVFSPETFVRMDKGIIHTYPMKGTIDASFPNARETIMNDPKELAEHVTIVDLMRNDLSTVATQVAVSRFRYIDELKTNNKNLLQVSSEIIGQLPARYESQIGSIVWKLLPAGSVTGAPKARTLKIIREAENEKRGYYAGVFGYFDGIRLDSAVMIRFIENIGGTLYYRSGGGITTQSEVQSEYQEAIDKIYVPID